MNNKVCERDGKEINWTLPGMGNPSICKECFDILVNQYQLENKHISQLYSLVIKRFRSEKKPSHTLFDDIKEDKMNRCIITGKVIEDDFLVNVCGKMVHPTICQEVFNDEVKKQGIPDGPNQYGLIMKGLKPKQDNKDKKIIELEKRLAELEKNNKICPDKNNLTRKDAYPVQYTNKTANGDYSIRCKYKGKQATYSLFSLPKDMKEQDIIKYCVKIKNVICMAIDGDIGKDNT